MNADLIAREALEAGFVVGYAAGNMLRCTRRTSRGVVAELSVRFDSRGAVIFASGSSADRGVERIEGRGKLYKALVWLFENAAPKAQSIDETAPASAPGRGTDAFDEIERTDAAAARFERDPQNRGSIEPARMPSRSQLESREVGPVAVDEIGPESARSFEISLWDNDEGEFVHAMMLPNREAAEALLHALGKLLLG